MSASELLASAHRAIAKGNGEIAIMLERRQISEGALREALSSIVDGVNAIASILPKEKPAEEVAPEKPKPKPRAKKGK